MKAERLPQITLENSADQRSSRSSRSDEVRSTSAPANVSSRRRDNSQTVSIDMGHLIEIKFVSPQ
jgi:hypothetical protein